MSEYHPDSWVMIKMTHKGETFYKVLGGWSGSYLNGTSWRLNSGVASVEKEGTRYRFNGASGSSYVCDEGMYGLRMSTASIWETMRSQYPDNVELMEDRDWMKFDFGA